MRKNGFTLIELLLGSAIMLIVLVATLSIYTSSNRTSVDQQQYAEIQNNVRSSIYFVAKDIRSAGVGLLPDIAGYFIEGTDAASSGPEDADCIRLMGEFDEPLSLRVEDYSGGSGGGSATAFLYDNAFDQSPYPCPDFYEARNYIIISTKCPGCYALRFIDAGQVHGCGTGTNHVNMNPGASDLNPPGGLLDTGCSDECWIDAIITLGQIKLYWLDSTGGLTGFKEFTLTPGVDGYIGQPGVLYLTTTLKDGGLTHLPIANNIENIQFQYNGDFDNDQQLDGFRDWDNLNWTILDTDTQAQRADKMDLLSRIRQVRMWVVGRTERAYVSVSGRPPAGVYLYRRPTIANSLGDDTDDRHRRFVLESTSNVRNMSLGLYNLGQR